jgi:ABC-type bacteriocin/lantibiotic exporter with double-glycine peptidase domain
MLRKLKLAYRFLGKSVSRLIFLDFLLGVSWFVIEAGFLLVFQGFLLSIGVAELQSLRLPSWYPTDLTSNLTLLIVYGLVRAVLTGLKKTVPTLASQIFTAEQRIRILRHSLFSVSDKTTADVVGSFGELTTKAGNFVLHCSTVLTTGVVLALLFALSIKLAPIESLVSFTLLFVLMLPFKAYNKKIRQHGEELVKEWAQANKVLVEGIRNIFLLRIYNLRETELEKGSERILGYKNQYVLYFSLSALVSSVPLFLGLFVIAVVTYISRSYLHTDSMQFVAFLYAFLRLSQNASTVSVAVSNALFYRESFLKLYHWGTDSNLPPLTRQSVGALQHLQRPVGLEISGLTFRYPSGPIVFDKLNLSVKPGQFLLVKGASGSGKSTLIKLVAGMVQPLSGNVLLDGSTPGSFISEHASSIGYVGPEPFMVPGTVRQNLQYGSRKTGSDELMWEKLREFGMADTINELPGKLDECLREDTQLSTGQKQRIAFARAVMRSPKLLVLDEATANIDIKTEQLILDFLRKIKGQVTVIAISHRESFDGLADLQINMGEA